MDKKVMVVDDDYSIRIAVKVLFESQGFEVFEADGGKECLGMLKNGFKGVIVMDIMMPEMDGCATVREIVDQGLFKGNAIFMLTAMDVPELKMQNLKGCVVGYIAKPFEPEELVNTVEGYFRHLQISSALEKNGCDTIFQSDTKFPTLAFMSTAPRLSQTTASHHQDVHD